MNKLRVAIVGCGYWGQNLIRNFAELDEIELAAVSDFDLNALARIKRRHPTVGLRHSFQEVISDPRIDAVVLATPVSTHYPFAKQALLAGKHVLVEKPLATSTEHVLDLIDIAEQTQAYSDGRPHLSLHRGRPPHEGSGRFRRGRRHPLL